MSHLDQDELAKIVDDAKQHVEVGAKYAHYKHPNDQFYTILEVALLEANDEPVVVYRAEYGANIIFVRPLSVWLETVEVDGQVLSRFAKVDC